MSYDIYLKERATGKTIELTVKHIMTGRACGADYDEKTCVFNAMGTTEAWLNVTYKYSKYYYAAAENDIRFYGEDKEGEYKNLGIRGIYGKSGSESIPMLKDMAERIQSKVATESIASDDYWTSSAANAVKPIYQLLAFAELRPDGIWMGD